MDPKHSTHTSHGTGEAVRGEAVHDEAVHTAPAHQADHESGAARAGSRPAMSHSSAMDHAAQRSMDHRSMGHMAGMADMADMEPGAMMAMHHEMAPWVDHIVIALGAWLIASPATLGYTRAALVWSDVLSGVAIIVFAWLSVARRQAWAPYATSLVGTWLLFAPLVFWSPSPAAYANDTLVGALVIGFGLLIPHGMSMPGPEIPPGWTYNPSSWPQRAPVIVLGLFGFLASRYMAAYQLGHTSTVWDPFFGAGTERVLESEVSRMFPVSDAGLGAAIYLLEVLMSVMGDPRRWRTMPWMVAFFAVLVVPLGVTSIVLVILQPLAVGTWCTLCLVAALAMLVMVPLMLDEVVAMSQLLIQEHRRGRSLWRAFWLGANQPEGLEAHPAHPTDSTAPAAAVWGMGVPWTLVASAALGAWLLVAPALFGTEASAVGGSDRLVGSLVITWALIALAEVARPVRFLNVPLGVWLLLAPWLLGSPSAFATVSDLLSGAALIALSLPRGSVRERYGTWNAMIR